MIYDFAFMKTHPYISQSSTVDVSRQLLIEGDFRSPFVERGIIIVHCYTHEYEKLIISIERTSISFLSCGKTEKTGGRKAHHIFCALVVFS